MFNSAHSLNKDKVEILSKFCFDLSGNPDNSKLLGDCVNLVMANVKKGLEGLVSEDSMRTICTSDSLLFQQAGLLKVEIVRKI